MFTIFTTTLIAGLIDGINPIALTQQFVLQSKIKSPYHILSFIFANSLVNFLFGMIFYFGFSNWFKQAFIWINQQFPRFWAIVSLLISVAIIIYLIYKFFAKNNDSKGSVGHDEDAIKNPTDNHLSPKSLFMIGVATCAAELTSAAPHTSPYLVTCPRIPSLTYKQHSYWHSIHLFYMSYPCMAFFHVPLFQQQTIHYIRKSSKMARLRPNLYPTHHISNDRHKFILLWHSKSLNFFIKSTLSFYRDYLRD